MTDTSADTSAVTPAPTPAADTAKPHRKRRRDATDGRTSRSRRYRALLKQFLADMGGPGGAAALTEAQRQLCARCATLSAECERIEQQINAGETVDFVVYGVVVDRLGRALQRIQPELGGDGMTVTGPLVKIEHIVVDPNPERFNAEIVDATPVDVERVPPPPDRVMPVTVPTEPQLPSGGFPKVSWSRGCHGTLVGRIGGSHDQ